MLLADRPVYRWNHAFVAVVGWNKLWPKFVIDVHRYEPITYEGGEESILEV